ncbi:MAG: IS1634 family transposase, partial [Acidobacteria bacterium]
MLHYMGMAKRGGSVHVATTIKRSKGKVYRTILLRRTYRDQGQVKHETLGNLSHLPEDLIELIRRRLSGESFAPVSEQWQIVRSLPHGHVVAVLQTMRRLGLPELLASRPSAERELVLAMTASRILQPASKLATARTLQSETRTSSLSLELGLGEVEERRLYQALDWLVARQARIEGKLARRHLVEGTLILYDVSGSFYTGRESTLVQFGYSRDGRPGLPQIVYGLLCNAEGCPVSVEVFAGNTADPVTFTEQIGKVRRRFRVGRVVFVGDRGMITSRRIDEDLRGRQGLDWITALRADSIQKLASGGVIERSLFDDRDLAEVSSPDYPGERLIVCRNPLLADQRARKRRELLEATEKGLAALAAAVARPKRALRGKERIALRLGRMIDRYQVAKHFTWEIGDASFTYARNPVSIEAESALDGLYVVRTSVPAADLAAAEVVRAYKDLAKVERAFRSLKSVDLKVRPIFHWLDQRSRAHVFLCMLAYYV